MSRPDEGLIHAWLDGELTAEEAARVERLVATDAEWGAAAAEARGLVAASSRILASLDHVPANVIPAGTRAAPGRRPMRVRTWMRVAAGLLLVAGTAYVVNENAGVGAPRAGADLVVLESAPTAPEAEGARASAPLSVARDSSLAMGQSAQAAQAAQAAPAAPTVAPAPEPTIGAPTERRVAEAEPLAAVRREEQAAAERASRERARAELATADRRDAGSSAPAPPPAAPTGDVRRERLADVAVTGVAGAAAPGAAAARAPAREAPQRAAAPMAPTAQAFAAKALSVSALEGCWRVTTTAGADSVLATPRVVRTSGDTLDIVAGPATRPATVIREVRDGVERLRGEMPDAAGRRVPFGAARVDCPAPRP